MPFVAHTEQEEVITPAQADSDRSYVCPSCESELRIRSSHKRGETFVSSHFWHVSQDSDTGCPGESDIHKRMKSIAMSKASNRWPNATVSWEATIGDRRADVLVEFPEKHPRYGKGVAIECQHKHEDKNIDAVNQDFTESGYSVLWLYEEHYTGKNVDLESGEWVVWWANEVPDVDDWTGYHGIIHWLSQPKPTSVDVDAQIPVETQKIAEQWGLRQIWQQNYKSQLAPETSICFPCGNCRELVLSRAVFEHKNNPFQIDKNWLTNLKAIQRSKCGNCGIYNRLTLKKIVLQTVEKDPDDIEENSLSQYVNSRTLLPCPRCQNRVEFDTDIKTTSDKFHPWSDIEIEPYSWCPDCSKVIKLESTNIRIVTNYES